MITPVIANPTILFTSDEELIERASLPKTAIGSLDYGPAKRRILVAITAVRTSLSVACCRSGARVMSSALIAYSGSLGSCATSGIDGAGRCATGNGL
jgi:hypothetical protein